MTVRAGTMRERITLERPTAAPDGYGGQIDGWETVVADIAAEVRPVSGNATTETEALVGTATHRITIRLWDQTADVDATNRAIWRGRVMKILGAVPDWSRRIVEISAEAGSVAVPVTVATLLAASAFHSHAAASPVLTASDLPALPAITRYVAPETGNDAADGLTPATAWRRAPGQAGATGVAAAYTPQPGDHIAFKRGERMHIRWTPPSSGTVGQPIIYSGNAWGSGAPCLHDGADFVTVRVPADQADAGGATNWSNPAMRVVEWTDDGRETVLLDASGLLNTAQHPRPLDPVLIDDLFAGPGLTYEVDGAQLIADQTITDAAMAAEAQVGGTVWVWVTASQFARRTISGIAGNTISLAGGAFSPVPYTPTTRAFLFNHVRHVTQPGDYAVIAPGKAIVLTRGSEAIRRGVSDPSTLNWKALRVGGGYTDLEFRGFRFSGFVGINAVSFASTAGGPLRNKVRGCTFTDCWDAHAIDSTWTTDAEFSWNRIERVALSGGISEQGVRANVHHNVITRTGGSALPSSRDLEAGVVEHNIISAANGVHANGASIYADQRGNRFRYNLIWNTTRPLTIQSQANPLTASDRQIVGNVLWSRYTAEERDAAGIYALRVNTTRDIQGMTFDGNLCVAETFGMLLTNVSQNQVVTNNWSTNGIGNGGGTPDNRGTWTQSNNNGIAFGYLDGQLIEVDRCDVLRPDGTRLTLDLRAAGAA